MAILKQFRKKENKMNILRMLSKIFITPKLGFYQYFIYLIVMLWGLPFVVKLITGLEIGLIVFLYFVIALIVNYEWNKRN